MENSCFLDLNEISWLYKQESIIFFLNLFRFFIFVCCKAVMLLFLFHIINKAFHFNCLIAIIIVQVYLVQQSRYTSTFWCFIYISSVHFIYACSVLSMIWYIVAISICMLIPHSMSLKYFMCGTYVIISVLILRCWDFFFKGKTCRFTNDPWITLLLHGF